VRWIWTFAALAALVGAAACTSSAGDAPSSPARTPTVSVPPPTASSSTGTINPGPPRATQPAVPADVPRTGPNTKRGEKPPVMPLEATQHTPEGAKAFAGFFIKTIDWGYATTSSAYMRHYFEPSCVSCRSAAIALDRARTKHRHFIGDRFTIRRVASTSNSRISVYFDVSSAETVDRHGKGVGGYPALTNFREDMHLVWTSPHWSVKQMVPRS
jgi:hypothetical protein